MGSYYTVLIVTRYSKFYWLLLRQNADLLPLIKLINFYEGKYYLQPAFMKHWHQRNLIKWGLKNGYIKKKKKKSEVTIQCKLWHGVQSYIDFC